MVRRAVRRVTASTPATQIYCGFHLKPCSLCKTRHLDQQKRFRCGDCGRKLCDLQSRAAFDHVKPGTQDDRCISINVKEL